MKDYDRWHTWHKSDSGNVWYIRDYDTGYLSVMKYEKGEVDPVTKHVFEKTTYKPLAQGYRLNHSFNNTYDDTPIYYETLEEAIEAVEKRWKFLRVYSNEVIADEKAGGTKRKELVKKNKELMASGKYEPYGE